MSAIGIHWAEVNHTAKYPVMHRIEPQQRIVLPQMPVVLSQHILLDGKHNMVFPHLC